MATSARVNDRNPAPRTTPRKMEGRIVRPASGRGGDRRGPERPEQPLAARLDRRGREHEADVGGVELLVDDRTLADHPAEHEVALEERRQPALDPAVVELVTGQTVGADEATGQRTGPELGRRQ